MIREMHATLQDCTDDPREPFVQPLRAIQKIENR